MGTIPFAFSVHKLINSVGADAGFASILGLAVLILLYFAQARETATLRDRLDEASNRAAALENRLTHLIRAQPAQPAAQPRVAAPPAQALAARPMGSAVYSVRRGPVNPLTAASGAAGVDGVPGPLVGAPVGMAAPALTAATKLIPTPEAAPALVTSIASAVAELENGDDTVLVAPGPVTVAAGANGHTLPPVAPPPSLASITGNTAAVPPAGPPPPPVQIRSEAQPAQGPRRTIPPVRPPAQRDPSVARRIVPALIGLGAIVLIVIVLLIITGGGSGKTVVNHPAKRTARAHRHHTTAKTAPFSPASVTVAVLNGTGITNLAHDVGLQLVSFGYKEGTVATAADQTHTTTIVAYTKGHEADAAQVAKSLKLSSSAVQPVDSTAVGVACPTSAGPTCNAQVIVTIGEDLSSAATSTPSSTTTTT